MPSLADVFLSLPQAAPALLSKAGQFDPEASYWTELAPGEEATFRQWVAQNRVPFNPDGPPSDYDMRGFFRALMSGAPRATTGADNTDGGRLHFGDAFKTPLHESYSRESQGATPAAPEWARRGRYVSAVPNPAGGFQWGSPADDWVLRDGLGRIFKDWRRDP